MVGITILPLQSIAWRRAYVQSMSKASFMIKCIVNSE
jgi:hypothetical protein